MLIAINYANDRFKANRKWCTWSLKHIGKVDQVIEYSPRNIDVHFWKKHKEILSYKRGGGLWLWKPWIILRTLNNMCDNDILLYCDSGTFIVHDLHVLTDNMLKTKDHVMAFQIPCLELYYTKRETYRLMNIPEEGVFLSNQICTGYILFRKSEFTLNLVKEWLEYMYDERKVSPRKFCSDILERPDFFAHREDQSIFSLVCKKHGVVPHWDPSDFGERPWEYASPQHKIYVRRGDNSHYPKCFLSCRTYPAIGYLIKSVLKDLAYKYKIMSYQKYLKNKGIPVENVVFDN